MILPLLKRDLSTGSRQIFVSLSFFVLGVFAFLYFLPPPSREEIRVILWVMAAFASMLTLEQLFTDDEQDGTLEQLLLKTDLPALIVLTKALSHWLVTGAPIVLVAAGVFVATGFLEHIQNVISGLLFGTLSFSLIGSGVAALICGAERMGVLMALLILPLILPVLVFGISTGGDNMSAFQLLVAVFLFYLVVAPVAGGYALKGLYDVS